MSRCSNKTAFLSQDFSNSRRINMSQRMTRRKFGQMAIAGTAVAGVSIFASKLRAQTAPQVLAGVGFSSQPSSAATVTSEVVVQTLALTTGQVEPLANVPVQPNTNLPSIVAPPPQPYAVVSGLTSMTDGTLILSSNPVGSSQQANPSRLTRIVGSSSQTIDVSGLDQQNALWSVLATNNGSLIGLVANKKGRPPYRLANINMQTGQVNFINFTLPANELFSNLVQCPNGNIYALSVGLGGDVSLVQLDLNQGQVIRLPQRLTLNGVAWSTGLNSLTCSGEGQFYALGNPNKYDPRLALYNLDLSTGNLTRQRDVNYNKVTFTPQT